MTFKKGFCNKELRLNDLIRKKYPEIAPQDDTWIRIQRSRLDSMLRIAMRSGAELVEEVADRYVLQVGSDEIENYQRVVRYEAIKKFVGPK